MNDHDQGPGFVPEPGPLGPDDTGPIPPVHPELDWRSIAARVALAGGAFHLLTTPERDELESAIEQERIAEANRDPFWVIDDAAAAAADADITPQVFRQVMRERGGWFLTKSGPGNAGPGFGPFPPGE